MYNTLVTKNYFTNKKNEMINILLLLSREEDEDEPCSLEKFSAADKIKADSLPPNRCN